MNSALSLAAFGVLLFPNVALTATPADGETFELAELIADLEASVPDLLEATLTPGAGIALIEDGAVVWERGFGLADVASKTPVTNATVFNIGSISKTIAAWGVMKLVEEGKLDLDAPAEQYLSSWKLPPSKFDTKGVTVRRLLSHTAGLSLHGYPGFGPDDELPSTVASLNGATNGSGAVELTVKPGTNWRYSGGGFTICQLIIEEQTGKSFADYMRAVFPALGMQTTGYDWPDELRQLTSTCYDELGRVTPNPRFTAQAAASLKTTVGSLARFGSLIFEGPDGEAIGRGFLQPETVAQMLTPQPASNDIYGLGYMMSEDSPGQLVYGHGGANRGWHATLKLLREERAGLVVLTNGSNGREVYAQIGNIWLRHRAGAEGRPYGALSVGMHLVGVIKRDGIEEALAVYEELKQNEPEAYRFGAGELNRLGMGLLFTDMFDEAILVLQLNVSEYPSANAYDSLGFAHMKRAQAGDAELAIRYYEESLRLNPNNDEGRAYLEELRKQ